MDITFSVFTILLCSGVLLSCSAQFVCKQNELRAHPNRCDQYLQCDHNSFRVRNCAVGVVYNEQKGYCDYVGNVPRCAGFKHFCERVTCPASTTCTLDVGSLQGYRCVRTPAVVPNACAVNPCVRGSCQTNGKAYRCVCPAGFNGPHCEFAITNACSFNPCLKGVCQPNGQSYTCLCQAGFAGPRCEFRVNPCIDNACNICRCVNKRGVGYQCPCAA